MIKLLNQGVAFGPCRIIRYFLNLLLKRKVAYIFVYLVMSLIHFPVLSSQQITIGKIYAAKLIYESFKEMKRRRGSTTSTEAVSSNVLISSKDDIFDRYKEQRKVAGIRSKYN